MTTNNERRLSALARKRTRQAETAERVAREWEIRIEETDLQIADALAAVNAERGL